MLWESILGPASLKILGLYEEHQTLGPGTVLAYNSPYPFGVLKWINFYGKQGYASLIFQVSWLTDQAF